MSKALDLLARYTAYLRRSVSRHGVHSPFVYGLIENVFRGQRTTPKGQEIEDWRKSLKSSNLRIPFIEMGAGRYNDGHRAIRDIARKSLSTPKQCAILARAVEHFNSKCVLELGTSLGISTAYLARNCAEVFTLEGNPAVVEVAKAGWDGIGLSEHIHPFIGPFEETLLEVLPAIDQVDLAFIDGDHRHRPTVDYFHRILPHCHDHSVLIFDDIHWSKGMEAAWTEIQSHPAVRVTIDCFWMGMVFIDPGLSREDFTIRY